mgnify:FL=1
MIFDFKGSIVSESIRRFSLNHFIDKISCFNRPASWNFSFFNLDLFRQNMIPNFFSGFTLIWTFSVHALICHYSYGEIIHRSRMILSTHNFWCHISWSSRCVLSIFWSPYSSNTKICYPNIAFHINDQVFRFNVSMNNLLFVTIFKTSY